MPFGGVLFISASGGLCSVAGLRREAGIRPPSPRGRAGQGRSERRAGPSAAAPRERFRLLRGSSAAAPPPPCRE